MVTIFIKKKQQIAKTRPMRRTKQNQAWRVSGSSWENGFRMNLGILSYNLYHHKKSRYVFRTHKICPNPSCWDMLTLVPGSRVPFFQQNTHVKIDLYFSCLRFFCWQWFLMTLGDKISLLRKIAVENCGKCIIGSSLFHYCLTGVTCSKAMNIRFTIRSVPLPKHRVQRKSELSGGLAVWLWNPLPNFMYLVFKDSCSQFLYDLPPPQTSRIHQFKLYKSKNPTPFTSFTC